MIEGCDRKVRARGLCHSCYLTAQAQVKSGRVSWRQLEKLGLCASKRGPNPFIRAFQEYQEKHGDLPGQLKMFDKEEQENGVE